MLLPTLLEALECPADAPYSNPDGSCTAQCAFPWVFVDEARTACGTECESRTYEDGPNGTFRCLEACKT